MIVISNQGHKGKAAFSCDCAGVHCSAPGCQILFLFLLGPPRLSNKRPATHLPFTGQVLRRHVTVPSSVLGSVSWVQMPSGTGEHAMSFQALWLSRGFQGLSLHNGQDSSASVSQESGTQVPIPKQHHNQAGATHSQPLLRIKQMLC